MAGLRQDKRGAAAAVAHRAVVRARKAEADAVAAEAVMAQPAAGLPPRLKAALAVAAVEEDPRILRLPVRRAFRGMYRSSP